MIGPPQPWGRQLMRVALLVGGTALSTLALLYGFAALLRPDLQAPVEVHSTEHLAELARRRDVSLDLADPPVVWREVQYPLAPDHASYPRGEPDVLAPLVASGRLPPVHERVGSEPLVLAGAEGIGRHGGTWHRVASAPSELTVIQNRLSAPTLVRWSPEGYPIVPHVARAWEVSPDHREFTFRLRRGMRWSDGSPFTAEDILFWWENDARFFRVEPFWMRASGQLGRVEALDAHTVRFSFALPNGVFLENLAAAWLYALPAHYLRPFHPRDGNPELIHRYMRELQLSNPEALYVRMKDYLNPECPHLWPWVYRTYTANPPYVFVRNPYYFAVDPAGNQLPYLDRLAFTIRPENQIGLAAALGEMTFQFRQIRYSDYTLLMQQQAAGGYEVYHWFQGARSMYTIFPNLNRRVDPGRPATRWKHELLNRREFRQALSLAIDRAEIIRAEFNGQSEVAQIDPGPGSPFHAPELFKAFTEHDPARANALLDSLGLRPRDGEGMRTAPDGTRLTFHLHTADYTGPGPAELIIDDWARVGIRAVLHDQARMLWQARMAAFEHDFSVWTSESEFYPMVEPRNFVPTGLRSYYAPGFGLWFQNGGLHAASGVPERVGVIEPPPNHPLRRAMELYDEATRTPERARQASQFREIQRIAAENLWSISIGTSPPQPVVVKRGLRNVPRNALVGSTYLSPGNAGMETWWLEAAADAPATIAHTQEAVLHVTPEPLQAAARAVKTEGSGSAFARALLRGLFGAAAILTLVLLAARHPYVGRRLVIMVPTLLVVSVVVFAIIEAPPGDYLSARIIELQAVGDEASVQTARDLQQVFHVEESPTARYLRWVGLRWFVTFDPGDTGLLQGNLGRSMETGRLVNDLVGDRILLTIVVSVLTLLFTCAVALPAGIYAAVRHNSAGDRLVTLVAVGGMCVPGFLLALVVLHLARLWGGLELSGLFSPEFALQPGWTWAKVRDLLAHIWLPVVVLGAGGTAGMARVMRANLLDELRKPYVTTALAKGMRPVPLLLKYPVRLAMHPFVSGLGALFPQLVSGGAVVAMVLALPMIGPLLLSALLVQDMYLAGSMLMVLSLMGVVGTLVSDLLLMVLDPRIRMEGGTR